MLPSLGSWHHPLCSRKLIPDTQYITAYCLVSLGGFLRYTLSSVSSHRDPVSTLLYKQSGLHVNDRKGETAGTLLFNQLLSIAEILDSYEPLSLFRSTNSTYSLEEMDCKYPNHYDYQQPSRPEANDRNRFLGGMQV